MRAPGRIPRMVIVGALGIAMGVLLGVSLRTPTTTPAGSHLSHAKRAVDADAHHRVHNGDLHQPSKSLGVYVGKNVSKNGSVLLGGFGQEPSSHWLEIVPRRHFPAGTTTPVGVTSRADYPGKLIRIPQARHTNRYITSDYSEFAGFPAPLTNGGLNEYGVAARDIWSPTKKRLLKLTKNPQTGPNYSDLSRIAMERARTARQAVLILGRLINKYGYSTYGGNSHLFADKKEGWIFIDYGGSRGLWAAERLGPNDVRVSYPGYLDPFPLNFRHHRDKYLASPNLVKFAVHHGWWKRAGHHNFDVQKIYGAIQPNHLMKSQIHPYGMNDQARMEREVRGLGPVSVSDMLSYIRDPRWSHDRAGYGQVAQLYDHRHRMLNALWVAVTTAATTPYVPIFIGARNVPPEYKQHRYLTHDSASTFLASDDAALEATEYATRTFKRLLYFTCDHPRTFLKPVTAELEHFEKRELAQQPRLHHRVRALLDRGRTRRARSLLTRYDKHHLLAGLKLGDRLVNAVEQQTRSRWGIQMPKGHKHPGETMRPESQSMNLGKGDSIVTCYRKGIDHYPRRHGSYHNLVGKIFHEHGHHGYRHGHHHRNRHRHHEHR